MFCVPQTAAAVRRPRPVVWAATALILLTAVGVLPGIAGPPPASGVISTVAGNGVTGWGGDGGPATLAETSDAYAVAVDAAGNLYIAQYGSNRVRKVSAATGIITTVAGNGTSGLSGDGGGRHAGTRQPADRAGREPGW